MLLLQTDKATSPLWYIRGSSRSDRGTPGYVLDYHKNMETVWEILRDIPLWETPKRSHVAEEDWDYLQDILDALAAEYPLIGESSL